MAPDAINKLPLDDEPLGWTFEKLSLAQRIALSLPLVAGVGAWQVYDDGWIAVPFLMAGILGGGAYLLWAVRRHGWSASQSTAIPDTSAG